MYRITAYSMWQKPQEFWADNEEEAKEIAQELKNEQYSVNIENLDDEGD